MKITLVTPAPPGSRKGNRITALRWRRMLQRLGHRVRVSEEYTGQPCDLLIALHARRSYPSIHRAHRERPELPIMVTLTGTDLYGDIRDDRSAQQSLEWATRLVVLQPLAVEALPERLRAKTRVILQSAEAPRRRPPLRRGLFEVCVLGHLRAVKDPFRTAAAARLLPPSSRVRVRHAGAALSPDMEKAARAEEAANPRYRWLGDLPRWRALRLLARSRLFVLTSQAEGGANTISEALAAATPILASEIPGSIGILGAGYPGYFPVGDTAALAALLHRAETDTAFYRALQRHCRRLRPLIAPARERAAWRQLLAEFTTTLSSRGAKKPRQQTSPR